MDRVLEQLKDGVRRFHSDIYPRSAELYRQAGAEAQRPHTLFITCADSRIDPNEITQTGPGELFVTRNIGNMVPTYGDMLGGVSAVVEFAVAGLRVQHIVVCGHSDCGAMKALLAPQSVQSMPAVENWLRNARGTAVDGPSDLPTLTERNVLLQMEHLRTHPSVIQAVTYRGLTLSGWVYDIGSGEVRIATDESTRFELL